MLLKHTDCSGFNQCTTRIKDMAVVDVGANTGGYVETFLQHGPRSVIAIEPAPRLVEMMRDRFRSEPVHVLQCGLSDVAGRIKDVTFYNCWTIARPAEVIGTRIPDVSPGAVALQPEMFDVELRTLDEVVDTLELHDLAFLKIDTDGYEPQVLRGAERTLSRQRPDILLELSFLPHEIGQSIPEFIAHIYSIGYTIATLDGRLVPERLVLEHFPWNTSLDVLMVPRGRYAEWPLIVG